VILNFSQSHGPPRPVTRIVLLFFFLQITEIHADIPQLIFSIIIKFPYVHCPIDLVLYHSRRSISLGTCPDSSVGIATSYGLDEREVGVGVPVESRILTSPRGRDRLSGSPNLLSNGYRGLFGREVKRPKREPDHSPRTSDEVKKIWICTVIPPIRLRSLVFN
jgi:hypothetical protein